MRNPLATSSVLITMMLAGCGDEPGSGENAESEGSGGASESADDGAGDGSGGAEDTGEEPTTGEAFVPVPARGDIKITMVEANPGVAVPIGMDGAPVGGALRKAYIPKDRDTLFRVFVDIPDGWTPRPIEARLILSGGGVDITHTQTLTIEADSFAGELNTTFYFGVEAEHMVPGLKYQVELWEAAPGQESLPEPLVPAVALQDGPSFVGVESALAEMRVMLVPVDYSNDGCNKVVDGEAHRKGFEDALFQQNGISRLEFQIHAPYRVEYDMKSYNGLSQLVGEMSQLRTAEAADPNVYYYALFDNCGACIGAGGQAGCTVGLAADITGDSQNDGRFRAAAGQLNSGAASTFVHEVGHTQGRRHIECAGAGVDAAGTDPSYPYEDGRIGVWGFGVRDFKLRHPTASSDYMSYCGQTGVSDWQWSKTYTRIVELSSWGSSSAAQPAGGNDGVLIGAVDPDGHQMWWTGPGDLSPSREPSATHKVVFEFADGEVEAEAQVSVREHYATRNIVARLPAGFDGRELVGVRLLDEDGEHEVQPKLIRRLHNPDVLKSAH